jgi:hypothetical protein
MSKFLLISYNAAHPCAAQKGGLEHTHLQKQRNKRPQFSNSKIFIKFQSSSKSVASIFSGLEPAFGKISHQRKN